MLMRGWSQRNNKDCFRSVRVEVTYMFKWNNSNLQYKLHEAQSCRFVTADSCNDAFLQRQCESDVEDTESKPASLLRRRLSSSS